MATSKITIADKITGNSLAATEFNNIKTVVNANAAISDKHSEALNGIPAGKNVYDIFALKGQGGNLSLGETSNTAYRGDRGKIAYDFSQTYNNLSTLLSNKQSTLQSSINIKTINNISLLGSGNINISGGSSPSYLVNVMDYGAVGNGNADDTAAFQAAINECIKRHGQLIIPPPVNFYNITNTLYVRDVNKNEVYMDVYGLGIPRFQIRYNGPPNTPCFQLVGLRFSDWIGVKVVLADNKEGLVAFDIDTIAPTSSTSFVGFTNTHIVLGNGINCNGYRLGLKSENGGDISCNRWDNCSVFSPSRDIAGQIGWSIKGSNTLHNTWVSCFGSALNTMVSNKNGGNGANYLFAMGTSGNNLDYYIQNTSNWVIEAGRLELGRRLLEVGYDNKSPSILIQGLAIGSYDGIDGRLIFSDMPCSIELKGVQVAQKLTGSWSDQTIFLAGGQYGPNTGIGCLMVDGGSVLTDNTTFYAAPYATVWKKYIRGVKRLASDGVGASFFTDINGQ